MTAPALETGHDPGERLYLPGDTAVHRLPAQAKIAATVSFVLVVVATPTTLWWAFAWYGVLLIGVATLARVPASRVLPRMAVEIPFVVFAVLLPFLGRPPTVEVLGLTVSQPGLEAAWNILAKATLGVAASVLLAATTRSRDLLDGLVQLRVPPLLVEIASFMLRYVHVVGDEWRRMGLARAARGFDAHGPRAWPTQARSAGVLFIRSYERGERVHLAMQARGYQGQMPVMREVAAGRVDWAVALALPVLALLGLLTALLVVP
jgi:cobalt/nickel transport system permease protein